MPAPQEILNLIERFEQNRESYMSGDYKEARVRAEFIDPFFKALGWDMNNEQGYAEAYKDVIHEDSIKIGSATEAPDYCFRVGGARKFFIEAKKPFVNVKDAIHPAYQLRRYGWSSKIYLSILTDFEEFAVYDCRIKPDKNDSAAVGRIMYLKYNDYPQKWEEIKSIFSREAILKGSFDKFAEGVKGKKGTAGVDDSFLSEIENWRELLAKNIAIRNSKLTTRELNFAVQKTIDRIIFLRICEDRGIELYGKLMSLVNGDNIYGRVIEYFRTADARYNSGLFHFQSEKNIIEEPDYLTQRINIDDKILKEIIGSLYYPECPFEFSVLPADILGQVYERFLGKVIRLTEGHQAKVEEKPEVRKAGGVYYTPTYIVDYIVENTVCKLLEGRKVDSKVPLRVADIACGSGSFLIVAYQKLLDWYLKKYIETEPEKYAKGKSPRIRKGRTGDWKLTINERKRILLEHIYGVDIDSQAVEVTKLSLLLKVLEGENEEIFQGMLFQERALPDLGSNIKCGNSLIGSDFYANRQADLFNEEEMIRVNAFDWQTQFPEVFPCVDAKGAKEEFGFDAVIGNPPFILLEGDFRDNSQLEYFRLKFKASSYKVDTYHLFIEQGIKLSKDNGFCSMITPANFLTNNNLDTLRKMLLQETVIDHIVIIEKGVFFKVSVDNAIFVLKKGSKENYVFKNINVLPENNSLQKVSEIELSSTAILDDKFALFSGGIASGLSKIWEKYFSTCIILSEIANVNFGKQLRDRKKYTEDVIMLLNIEDRRDNYCPCYTGGDVYRYHLKWGNRACYDNEIARKGGCWDSLAQNAKNKIVTRQIGKFPEFAIDVFGFQCLNTIFMINIRNNDISPLFILGILNSFLIKTYWLDRFCDKRRTFPKIKGTYLKEIPIPKTEVLLSDKILSYKKIISTVTKILDLNKRLTEAKVPDTKTMIQRQIEATDKEIDRLVYELYGLTADEIMIVEGKNATSS